jgi:hypothetical protein
MLTIHSVWYEIKRNNLCLPLAELKVSGYARNDTSSEAVTSSDTEPESSSTVITVIPCCPLTKSTVMPIKQQIS